jgi:hypothetical protein
MGEVMTREEWCKWFVENILPSPHNEWGISKDEFKWVSGWNDFRATLLQQLFNHTKEKEVK